MTDFLSNVVVVMAWLDLLCWLAVAALVTWRYAVTRARPLAWLAGGLWVIFLSSLVGRLYDFVVALLLGPPTTATLAQTLPYGLSVTLGAQVLGIVGFILLAVGALEIKRL